MNFKKLTIAAAIVAMTSLSAIAPVYAQAAAPAAPAAAAVISFAEAVGLSTAPGEGWRGDSFRVAPSRFDHKEADKRGSGSARRFAGDRTPGRPHPKVKA